MSTTLPLFWDLSSVNTKARLDASVKLIGALERLQTSFVPKEPNSGTERESSVEEGDGEDEGREEDGQDEESKDETKNAGHDLKQESEMLNQLNAGDVSYSIRRLVRGLASPRESSRLGFAVALTELLSRIHTITCGQILAFVLDASHTAGSMSGQEERDMLFARLFGITSIIQSDLLFRTQPLPSSASAAPEASSLASYTDVLSHLFALGEKKPWLRESAWWSVNLAIDKLQLSAVRWKSEAIEHTIQQVFVDEKAWSPEKIALGVKVQEYWPEHNWSKLFAPTIKHGDVLHSSNMTTLARILKEVEADEDGDISLKKSTRVWKPQVHYTWDVLLDNLFPTAGSGKESRGSFREFWKIVVDESLFATSASNSRKYWGFEIVQKVLPRIREAELPMLFTKNFMRTWMNHLSHADRYLHRFAKQISASISEIVQKNPTSGFSLILQLTGVHGSQQFDKLTKTKTVESILTKMDVKGIEGYVDYLLAQAEGHSGEDVEATNTRRLWIIEQLTSLIRNGSTPKQDHWIQLVLDWLTVHGLFIVKKKSEKSPFRAMHSILSPPMSGTVRRQCRERLLSCIAELAQQTTVVKTDDGQTQKSIGVTSDGHPWVLRTIESIVQLEGDKHVKLLMKFNDDHVTVLQKAKSLLLDRSGPTDDCNSHAGARLILGTAILLQYLPPDGTDFDTSTLESCIDGASKLLARAKKSSKKNKGAEDRSSDSGPEAIDILVDVVIGFLEKSTSFARALGNQSFALLSGSVRASTVDLILAQLERKTSAELLADSEEEMGSIEGSEDAGSGSDDEESEVESEHDGDDEDGDEGDGEGDEEAEELRKKLADAFGAQVNADDQEEEDDDEDMDDEQMMAIDEQLAAIFKEQTKGKSRGENEQREAIHFKNRILDLVDIFIKKQPASPYVLLLIIPLLEVIFRSTPDEKQLAEKATGLLRSRIAKAKDVPTSGVDIPATVDILSDLHVRARKARGSNAIAALAACSAYVSRVLLFAGEDATVLRVYRESLVEFSERKASDLNAKFFEELMKRHPAVGWKLSDDLIGAAGNAINAYRRVQIYGLIRIMVRGVSAGDYLTEEVIVFISSLQTHLHAVVLTACTDLSLNAGQLKEILTLALDSAKQAKRLSLQWKSVSWSDVQAKLTEVERFKASQGLHRMVHELGLFAASSSEDGRVEKRKEDYVEGSSKSVSNGTSKAALKKRKADGDAVNDIVSSKKKAKKAKGRLLDS